ncbi:MAG TPA: cell envelope integrity protein TolA [Caldimonas sp.]|jgi:colicin import membrane protein|nr:cell envelope integrity protein TolA [Caldimonas sp.]
MNAAVLERDRFAPQQPPGMRSGLALAILAHVLLIIALAWSVNWKASEPEGVVAELWSALPQTAAPRAAPPEPKPTPVEPKPAPPPPEVQAKPAPVVKPEPAPPPQADAQIAIERAAREQARRQEAEREAARQAELKKREDARREDAKRAEAKRLEAERQRVASEQAEKKQLAEQAKKDEARQAAIREANLRRMMSQAGSSDEPAATGNAARTSGPSAGYAGRIKARIKPNIVLTTSIAGNPSATVEVKVAPDGTIVGRKLVTSSGSAAWDETVLRAIDKTEILPKDVDGRVPPTMTIAFKPLE